MASRGKGCAIGCVGLVLAAVVMAGGAYMAYQKIMEVQGGSLTMQAPGTQVSSLEAGRYTLLREGTSTDLAVEIVPEAGGEPLGLTPPSMSMTLNQYHGWREFSVGLEGSYAITATMQEGTSEMLLFLRVDELAGAAKSALIPVIVGLVIGLIALIWGGIVFLRKT